MMAQQWHLDCSCTRDLKINPFLQAKSQKQKENYFQIRIGEITSVTFFL